MGCSPQSCNNTTKCTGCGRYDLNLVGSKQSSWTRMKSALTDKEPPSSRRARSRPSHAPELCAKIDVTQIVGHCHMPSQTSQLLQEFFHTGCENTSLVLGTFESSIDFPAMLNRGAIGLLSESATWRFMGSYTWSYK